MKNRLISVANIRGYVSGEMVMLNAENLVYRLGFKASNETAQKFQALLADRLCRCHCLGLQSAEQKLC